MSWVPNHQVAIFFTERETLSKALNEVLQTNQAMAELEGQIGENNEQ